MTLKMITVIRYLQAIFATFPAAFALIGKIRAAFGSDKVREAIKALGEFIDRIAPPAPREDGNPQTTDRSGEGGNSEKRRRFTRFMNRTRIAGKMAEYEVQDICAKHLIQPYAEKRED